MRAVAVSSCLFFLLLFSAVSALAAEQSAPAPRSPEMEKAFSQLDTFARSHLAVVCRAIRPSLDMKEVEQRGGEFIARYLAVDVDSLTTDITVAHGPGAQYIGTVIYYEHIFESRGKTSAEALAGEFEVVRMRHVTHLFRYHKGKWIN